MACLLFRLEGVMQSWGTTSRGEERDTGTEPTKSGVVGLICAAMGRDRSRPVGDLAALKMAVRVDAEGVPRTDFQTAGGGKWKGRPYRIIKAGKGHSDDAVTSNRQYLSDAVFLVGLEGDAALLRKIEDAFRNPCWLLGLGRKSFPPSNEIFLKDGLRVGTLVDELRNYPWLKRSKHPEEQKLRIVLETGEFEGDPIRDVPIDWSKSYDRIFGVRYVRTEFCPVPKPIVVEVAPACT